MSTSIRLPLTMRVAHGASDSNSTPSSARPGTRSRPRARPLAIESIVRPGKEIAPQFVSWLVVSSSGQSLVGVLVRQEATGEQTYADQHGKLFDFKPGEIDARRVQSTSIMPDDLARQLTLQEFRDLVAFLRSP